MSDPSIHRHLGADAADPDPQESAEWRAAFASVLAAAGPQRARQLMDLLESLAREPAVGWQPAPGTPYVNTITAERQAPFPGDLAIEERLASLRRVAPRSAASCRGARARRRGWRCRRWRATPSSRRAPRARR